MKSRTLLIVALEKELPTDGLADQTILYTDLEKVNAAINLMTTLTEAKPDLLVNYGTAGAIKTSLTYIAEVGQSVQYDMDARLLGIALGSTPFETETECLSLSDSPMTFGTADRFTTFTPELSCDLVNVALYTLAKIAEREKIPQRSLKFISDYAYDSTWQDWKDSLLDATSAFLQIQDDLRNL